MTYHRLPPPSIPAIDGFSTGSTPTTVFSPNDENNVLQYQGVKDGVQVDIFQPVLAKLTPILLNQWLTRN